MKNKWTSIGGLVAGAGGILAVIGQVMQGGEFDNAQFALAVGLIGAGLAGLKGTDGTL
jgi:hypothetical protein